MACPCLSLTLAEGQRGRRSARNKHTCLEVCCEDYTLGTFIHRLDFDVEIYVGKLFNLIASIKIVIAMELL
jgi:hypothetical protein